MGNISGDSGGTTNVEQGELGDERVLLEEERQRLSDSSSGSEHGDLDGTGAGGGEGTTAENGASDGSEHVKEH